MIQLVAPTIALKSSFLEGLREFQAEGLPWHAELDAAWVETHFEQFVASQLAKVSTRTDTLVPATELWSVLDGEYVGRIAIRHELNEALQRVGGHIGYDTRPTYRGRGIASEMLKAALPIARQLGLFRVLLTCDDTNAASIRVIEKSGGVLEGKKTIEPGRPLKRYYWIDP